jgi:ABC-2 type transport system ATP-binding protein
MFRLEQVTKAYRPRLGFSREGTVAVRSLSLEIGRGVFGLVGPNGAGKTTLIRMLTSILRPTAGRICFEGTPLPQNAGTLRKRLGYLPQEFGFYPYWTVTEALGYGCWLKAIPGQRASAEILRTLELAGLQEHRNKWVRHLSGGLKKRLGIAFALLGDPDVVIVDEPTAGLDPEERVRFRLLMESLGLRGLTLVSTHIIDDLTHGANALAMMKDGELAAVGSPKGFLDRTARNVFEGEVHGSFLSHLPKGARVVHVRRAGESVLVRLVAEQLPSDAFSPATPSLEDAYLYIISREHRSDDAQ